MTTTIRVAITSVLGCAFLSAFVACGDGDKKNASASSNEGGAGGGGQGGHAGVGGGGAAGGAGGAGPLVPAGCPKVEFADAVGYPTGKYPVAVAAAPLTAEGNASLVVANYGADSVSVFLNNGDGTFQDKVDYPAGSEPDAVAVGDIDGDGEPDLVVANARGGGGLSVLINNGDGTFGAATSYDGVGFFPSAVAVANLGGDDHFDVVTADETSGGLSALTNDGTGTLQDAEHLPTGAVDGPIRVVLADFDGDGTVDIAASASGQGTESDAGIAVLLNKGDGTFKSPVNYAVGTYSWDIATADLDGDGHPDLVTFDLDAARVLLNDGHGAFSKPVPFELPLYDSSAIAVGDMNGEGTPDLLVLDEEGKVTVMLNTGEGTFAAGERYVVGSAKFANSMAFVVADFDGDGTLDVATANQHDKNVSVLLNQGCAP